MILAILLIILMITPGWAGDKTWDSATPGCLYYQNSKGVVERVCDGDLSGEREICYQKMQEVMKAMDRILNMPIVENKNF